MASDPVVDTAVGPSLRGRLLGWLALVILGLGLLGLALSVNAFLIGLVVLGPAQALGASIDEIWFQTNAFSLDLFQVFIERKLFFWLPNPTDPWFNVIRPILFRRPVTVALAAIVIFALGRVLRRVSRRV